MPTCTANGTTLHYETAGTHGPPVVLIMGLRARGIAWLPIIEQLRDTHQVLWFDHRGIGESAPLEKPVTSMEEMAADAVALMDHQGWDTAHVAGGSMGGMIAQHVALHHRHRLRSLSLFVTTAHGRGTLRFKPSNLWRYLGTMRGTPEQRLMALGRILYSEAHLKRWHPDDLIAHLKRGFGHEHPGTWRAQVGAIARHDVRSRLPQIDTPALVVGAGGDRLVPCHHARRLHAGLPVARYLDFPDAAHGVIAEESEAIGQAMAALIAEVEGRPSTSLAIGG